MPLVQALEELVDIYERRGVPMRSRLRPGLSRREIDAFLRPLGIAPPEELYQLYEWHDGVIETPVYLPMFFCDYQLLSIQDAIVEHDAIVTYFDHPLLSISAAQCFPFASFQAQYCAIYCEDRRVGGLSHPVIEIFDAYVVRFEDIEHVALTAAALLNAGVYDVEPVDEERWRAIQRQTNPRVDYSGPGL